MDLHRADKKPDWDTTKKQQWNAWQKVASATGGIVTIGNFFSTVGLLSVALGLWIVLKYQAGLWAAVVLALGRICDLLDGWLADKTDTKSPLGEMLDATFDKIAVFATLLALLLGGQIHIVLVLLLLVPHALTAIFAISAYVHGRRLHVSRLGKNSMALGWIFMLLFIAAISPNDSPFTNWFTMTCFMVSLVVLGLSVVTGLLSFAGYIRDYLRSTKKAK